MRRPEGVPGIGCTSDEVTTAAVSTAISKHAELGAPNQIQVSSNNHVVYLTGIVDTGYQRSVAGTVAARTDGVVQAQKQAENANTEADLLFTP
jgi:osmotically-inducible protein OsmY